MALADTLMMRVSAGRLDRGGGAVISRYLDECAGPSEHVRFLDLAAVHVRLEGAARGVAWAAMNGLAVPAGADVHALCTAAEAAEAAWQGLLGARAVPGLLRRRARRRRPQAIAAAARRYAQAAMAADEALGRIGA